MANLRSGTKIFRIGYTVLILYGLFDREGALRPLPPPVKDRVKGLIASLVCINAKCKCLWALKEKIKIPFLLMPVLSMSLFLKINLLSDI